MWVLVVDDDSEVRRVVRRGLEGQGCQVAEAADGSSALAMAGALAVDVAILDRQLPGMSGLELMVELRRRVPSVHIIMLTGASAEADRVLGLVSGADDYMVKPFSARELAARVVAARRRQAALSNAVDGPGRTEIDRAEAAARPHSAQATVILRAGKIVSATPAAVELFGASSAEQVLGHDVFSFITANSVATARAHYERSPHDARSAPDLLVLRRLDGNSQQVLIASAPAEWQGLPASEVSLWPQSGSQVVAPQVADPVGDEVEAVVLLDGDARIQTLNPAAERLYGWAESELRGHRLSESIGAAMTGQDLAALHATFESLGHWHGEVDHHRRDGSTVRVRSSSTVLRHVSGEPAGVVLVNRELRPAEEPGHDQVRLADEIRRGVAAGEFVVHYQPIVLLDDASVVGVEALVRWQHPERGLLFPGDFMDVAEQSGAIVDLGAFVLDESRAQWARWRDAGHSVYVSVNLSGHQLADPHLPDLIAATPLPEGQLWLEVTETSLVQDLAQAGAALTKVTDLGPKVSIDDFGTGWASMTYLREFPVHALKIDRSFVRGIGTSAVDTAIVTSVLALGRELGLKVFAEGIETQRQHDELRALGCKLGQGYLFGRPVPPDEIELKAQ